MSLHLFAVYAIKSITHIKLHLAATNAVYVISEYAVLAG